nr:hypothetical protein [Pedobacter sp. ASV19]
METTNNCNCFNNRQIINFFKDYNLEESQSLLWKLFKLSTAAKPTEVINSKEWLNLVSFYENLDDLLKAIYTTYQEQTP